MCVLGLCCFQVDLHPPVRCGFGMLVDRKEVVMFADTAEDDLIGASFLLFVFCSLWSISSLFPARCLSDVVVVAVMCSLCLRGCGFLCLGVLSRSVRFVSFTLSFSREPFRVFDEGFQLK